MQRKIAIPAILLSVVAICLYLREERTAERPPSPRPLEMLASETSGPAGPTPEAVTGRTTGVAPLELRTSMPPRGPDPIPSSTPWRPGYMGLNGQDAVGGGALITQIFTYTAAERSGLRAGDIIVEFNDVRITGLEHLFQLARGTGEGAPVSLRIRRAGSEFYLGLQLGRHPLYN